MNVEADVMHQLEEGWDEEHCHHQRLTVTSLYSRISRDDLHQLIKSSKERYVSPALGHID